jgi:glycosyltransferase involved in cell wall biosynthesis
MSQKISILIANFNNGKYFKDCWDSLLNQTSKNWEAIIVDDASNDNSLSLIKEIVGDDARALIYCNEINKGVGYTKHKCIQLANNNLVGFLDPDDLLEPISVEEMLTVFENQKDIVLAYSKKKVYDENLNLIGMQETLREINSQDPYFFNFGAVISCFSVFRRDRYFETDGIDTYMRRAVDQDLYYKLCEIGKTYPVDVFMLKYRKHNNGISVGDNGKNYERAKYWQWLAINAAAKRRGIIVEDLFIQKFVDPSYKSKYELIINSGSYKLATKITTIINFILRRN